MQGDPPDFIVYDFRIGSIEDATNDKYSDRVGENYEGPTIHHHGAAVLVTVRSSSRLRLYAPKTRATRHY
jgi:hypothetical protein